MSYQQIALGDYRFSVDTAQYNELTHSTEYAWTENPRYQNRPGTQTTGIGIETVSLRGVIFPEMAGGSHQLKKMRAEADKREPLQMVSERGENLGRWCIKRIEDTGSYFLGDKPRKIEFTMELTRFGDDE